MGDGGGELVIFYIVLQVGESGYNSCSQVLHNIWLILKYQTFKLSTMHRFIKDKAGENINTI